jgi:hypothetical protein
MTRGRCDDAAERRGAIDADERPAGPRPTPSRPPFCFFFPWPFGPSSRGPRRRQALWGSEGGDTGHRCFHESIREARRPRNPQRGHAFCTAIVSGLLPSPLAFLALCARRPRRRQALWGSEGGEAGHRCLRVNSREARRPRNPQRGHAFCTATVFGPAGSRTIGVLTVRARAVESGRDHGTAETPPLHTRAPGRRPRVEHVMVTSLAATTTTRRTPRPIDRSRSGIVHARLGRRYMRSLSSISDWSCARSYGSPGSVRSNQPSPNACTTHCRSHPPF